MEPEIEYQDDAFFVVNKPSGWITNEASTTSLQPVVQAWIKDKFKYQLKDDYERRNGIVHRLDKETSGVLLVAKTAIAFDDLQSQFKDRVVQKNYVALSHGDSKQDSGVIEAPVGRLPWRRDRFGVLPGGRDAITEYEVLARFTKLKEKYTYFKLFPKTGRTHQIRIHLKYINHPIVSDQFYAGRKTSQKDRKWCPRLFLHAKEISFVHPLTRKRVTYSTNLHSDLQIVIDNLSRQ